MFLKVAIRVDATIIAIAARLDSSELMISVDETDITSLLITSGRQTFGTGLSDVLRIFSGFCIKPTCCRLSTI